MGPSPSPRHGLTMTAVREKLYVLGGDNETTRLDDSSLLFILDSTKIKYPSDIPQPPPPQAPVDASNNQPNYDTSSIEEMNGQQQQYYQPQQQFQQQQQQGQVPQQQFQQPFQQQHQPQSQKHYPDQRQQPQPNQTPPPPQQQQQPQRSLTSSNKSGNSSNKEIDTSMNYTDNNIQPSPTNSSSPSSLTSPRHRSYYPENQSPSLTQVITINNINYI